MMNATTQGDVTTDDYVTTDITNDYSSDYTTCDYLPECTGLGLRDPDVTSCPDDGGVDTATIVYEGDTCPSGYFNTGECCLNQWWIIGLSAGISGVIIITLLSVVIWLCCNRKKDKKKKKKPLEDGAALTRAEGVDNLTFNSHEEGDNVITAGNSEDGVVIRPNKEGHRQTTLNEYHATPSRSREGSLSHEDYYVNHDVSPRHSSPVRPLSNMSDMLYDDIDHFNPHHKAVSEQDYYNVPDLIKRSEQEGHHSKKESITNSISGIDLSQFADFQPTLSHIDTRVDYSIKRPQML